MRGEGTGSEPHMWSYVPLERRIPSDHPLRPLRVMVDAILSELSPQFDQLYSKVGRPSIPPLLLQVLYSVRSERLLMEQLDYNLLFRWFPPAEHVASRKEQTIGTGGCSKARLGRAFG